MNKTAVLVTALSICCLSARSEDYASPYTIRLDVPITELNKSDSKWPRNSSKDEADIPYANWYSDATRRKCNSWGPHARHFPPPAGCDAQTTEWKRQRIVAVATKYLNLPYQHHHIPSWQPPQDWPWKTVPYGKNSKGLDCSNFTSWVYNYGLGIKFTSDVHRQSALRQVSDGASNQIQLQTIPSGTEYGSLLKQLRAGDLLFIRHKNDEVVSHVVIWLGKYGQSSDGTPLVIDCSATTQIDRRGVSIPGGVQIRPFGKSSWYFNRFHHASRILQDAN